MSAIIPFDQGKLPSAVQTLFGDAVNDLVGTGGGSGFPVISIKGKVFHITRGDAKTLITKPGEDDPASSIEIVVVRANPNRSKVYYDSGYSEGSNEKPTCYSNDGDAPAPDAKEPQSKKCATCVHNQWGSKVSEAGTKLKSCSDSRRLAIATLDAPSDLMLLRVPAASMKPLEEYGKMLAARGLPPQAVVTKVGFDYSVAHPALTFKPVGLIGDAALLKAIKTASDSDLAAEITGVKFVPKGEAEVADETATAAAPAPSKAAASKEAVVATAVAAAEGVKPAKVKTAAPAAEQPATKAAAQPKPAKETTSASLSDDIEAMLNELDI